MNKLVKKHNKRFVYNIKKNEKFQYWYFLLISFPVLLIFVNVSFYVFFFLINSTHKLTKRTLKIKTIESKLALLFVVGVLVSVFDIWSTDQGVVRMYNGIKVLPNYIYWGVILVFFSNSFYVLNFNIISKGIFWGLILCVVYFYFPLFKLIQYTFFFNGLQQNLLSALLIMFTPIALYYLKIKNHTNMTIVLLGCVFFLAAILSGSRSGSVLVFINVAAFIVLFIAKRRVFLFAVIFFGIPISIILANGTHEEVIKTLNPRVYELLFAEDVFEKDASYLTRLAIVEKGLSLFSDNPLTGVGVNNFGAVKGRILFNFEGGDLIAHDKDFFQKASAHNSYLSILTETGLVGFVPFIILLLVSLIKLLKNSLKGDSLSKVLILGYLGLLIHMYFISVILNVYAWVFIGLIVANNRRFS